jgi:hypothetical protein
MKWIVTMLAVASVMTFAAQSASAQLDVGARPQIYSEMVPPDRGTAEIGFAFSSRLTRPSATSLDLSYLPYLNRNIQVGGRLNYITGTGIGSAGALTLRGVYNFVSPTAATTGRTVPYVGLFTGFGFGDARDAWLWGVNGGVKHFISNDISVFAELNWENLGVRGAGRDNDTYILAGLNTYLRSPLAW